MRYRLRTLLTMLAVLPPLLWFGWTEYSAWRAVVDRNRELRTNALRQAAIKDVYRQDRERARQKQSQIERLIEKNRRERQQYKQPQGTAAAPTDLEKS